MNRPWHSGLVALALTVVFAGSLRAAPADLDRVMESLAQREHGHVTFVEHKYLAVLERPLESSGELLYDAPDRLEKRTLKPKPESLVLERGVVTAQRGRRKYVLDLREYPQIVPFVESIRATLAGDRAGLERVFELAFEGDFGKWTLSLVPLDQKLRGTVRRILVAGRAGDLDSVEITDADGDRSVLSIGGAVVP